MKLIMLFTAALLALTLCACGKTETVIIPVERSAAETSAPAVEIPDISPVDKDADIPEYIVNIYFGDENAENLLHEAIIINELSPDALLQKLLEKGVFSEEVAAGAFSVDNYNIIHLDLDESFSRQMNSMGTSGEYIMLGSLANTFIDAFDADGLSLTVDGKTLETGHTIYDFTITFINS